MDTSQKSILQKYGVTEELLREEEEKQLKQDLWWKTASFVTGRPENVQQKRAQECLKELVEDKVHSKFLPPIESKLNSPISQAKKQGSVKWMWIMDPQFGSMKFVQVKVDSGARKNFITEGMVVDHHLQKTALEEPQPFDLAVGGIYCSYKVQVSLMGQDNEQATADFFVLPNDARIEIPLVGEEWTAHFMCKLFDSKDGGSIAYVEQKKPKVGLSL